ncbi:UPF0016-domain-containing protein [Exidia glandulosa HHB12029]|uniref:GDT1 family protein n=1 Tax=Exidia glandulosa HHB12029 TaxID=1314781 RepID=A0A166A2P7_EXIGL|nr:UPF0016-domain-containing protein [Exidia glandulosa HHB12029]KZV88019.1 UPF0016-domain-containing protein [Exidia glandulosa HHB12029]
MGDVLDDESNTHALVQAFCMIIVSELGDKTFLIAAILAMRHPRLVVFAGAFGSLVVMSILSAVLGHILPALIPKKWTQFVAAMLFLIFGGKMLLEARDMQPGSGAIQEEMREVEEELEEEEAGAGGETVMQLHDMEEGHAATALPPTPKRPKRIEGAKEGFRNLCGLFFGPVFIQAFLLTFLGEWGDRSQIATMVLAAAHNVYIISLGTILGHSLCTALAVIAGKWLASKISVKHVTYGGAFLFIFFALFFFREAWTLDSKPLPHQELGEHDHDWIPH